MTTVFVSILLANSLTLVIEIVAAIKRPRLSCIMIGAVALCATFFALQQFVTGEGNLFALLCTVLLIIMIAWPRSI